MTSIGFVKPEVVIEGKELEYEPYGILNYRFKTSGCPPDSEKCSKSWRGTMKLNYKGNDTIIPFGQEYFVRKACESLQK